MKLSLCIATYNEIQNIHYALDSAYDFVDEIIVVDGGSDDGTIEKVKSYGAKVTVIVTDNPPIFHINKQKALDAATGDWILQLDADEAVSPELKQEIQGIMADTNALDAYWIPRKNYFLGRFLTKGGQYPDYTIRLYKRGAVHFPCESVHEQVAVTGGEARTGKLKTDLLHYADPTFDRYLMRWNRYTSLDASFLAKEKKQLGMGDFLMYFFVKPMHWFLLTYLRHKGFQDGFPGFVFSLFSGLRFWVIYIKTWALLNEGKR